MLQHRRQTRQLRLARAALRDARLILRESGGWLAAFLVLWLAFGLLLWRLYRPGGAVLTLPRALYVAFAQLLFQPQEFPGNPLLQVLFFLAPAVGLLLVGRGALNAG